MLLYDRVVEVGARMLRRHGPEAFGADNVSRLASLTTDCPVYDLTNVAPLFDDYQREKAKRVPRRPPHDKMWAEWSICYEDKEWKGQHITWRFRVGCLLLPTRLAVNDLSDPATRAAAARYPRHYLTRMFRFIEGMPEGMTDGETIAATRGMLNKPMTDCDCHFWLLNDDGTEFEVAWMELGQKAKLHSEPLDLADTILGLSYLGLSQGNRQFDNLWVPWPMWMAFGLLHCRNIVEDVIPPDVPARAVARSGNPPRAYARVLRVVLPRYVRRRGPAAEGGDGDPVRFHLRSGHMKNLVHPRYEGHDRPGGNWHWWNACWAGSRDRGVIPASRPRVVG